LRALARFAAVGTITTVADVAGFLVLRLVVEWAVVPADAAALVLAGVGSYALHHAVTFHGDPYRRRLERWPAFFSAVLVGGLVDLIVVVALATVVDTTTITGALLVKLPAVVVAGIVRWMLHRWELLLLVRGGQLPRTDQAAAPGDLRYTVVLPAFREADRIGAAVAAVHRVLHGIDGGTEVVVVDDGSDDDTATQARAAGAEHVVMRAENGGKGAAIRAGIDVARGRTIAFTDADLAYPPDQLRPLLSMVEEGWDVVVGSRRHLGATTLVRAGRLRELGGRVINWLTYAVLLGGYRDTQCGLKAFRSDAARQMSARARIDGFAFDIELFVMAERNGLALGEMPVQVVNTTRSTVRPARDGLRLVRDLFRIRRWAREGLYQLDAAAPAARGRQRTHN
jgi:putative flippase GtrA